MTNVEIKRFWDPLTETALVNGFTDWARWTGESTYPAMNVWFKDDDAELTAEIPGIDRDSIDITVSGDTVTIKGKRSEEKLGDSDTYYRHELRHGDFCKSVRLPFTIDADKVDASYSKGVLKVRLVQSESEKPRRIKITSE
jgi:HSP20 family protein